MRSRTSLRTLLSGLLLLAAGCGESFTSTGSGGSASTSSGGGATTSSSGGSGGRTTTGPACDLATPGPCDECLVDACPEAYCQCAGDQDCLDMGLCLKSVMSVQDLQTCWKDHKDNISLIGQIQVCGHAHCDACGYGEVDPCLACEYQECPKQTNDCLGDPKCVALGACFNTCVGKPDVAACQSNCLAELPDGAQHIQALIGCANKLCPGECG